MECICHPTTRRDTPMTDAPIPVIFIHGLWLHPLSWTEWADMFQAAGYDPSPGSPARIRIADRRAGRGAGARDSPDPIVRIGPASVT
jgi:non-heme chloroperoxidase